MNAEGNGFVNGIERVRVFLSSSSLENFNVKNQIKYAQNIWEMLK